jgi:hypothetical protein
MNKLQEIKDRWNNAPPGPWRLVGKDFNLEGFPQVEYNAPAGHYIKIHGNVPVHGPPVDDTCIAFAHEDILYLLELIDGLSCEI